MDTQSVPNTIIHEEGRKNGVIHKEWYDHGRTSRTASYGPASMSKWPCTVKKLVKNRFTNRSYHYHSSLIE